MAFQDTRPELRDAARNTAQEVFSLRRAEGKPFSAEVERYISNLSESIGEAVSTVVPHLVATNALGGGGGGGGTVTSVQSGDGLTGGPITGTGTLSVDFTVARRNDSNVFTGAITATSFSGSGAALTNLSPTNISAGTAAINISGNAATVTNGLYSTGSYSNPSWLTSLAGSKISGTVAAANGGVGVNTSTAAAGSLLYTSATGVWTTLAPGVDGLVLKLTSGLPSWQTESGGGGGGMQWSW